MHELPVTQGILDVALAAARQAGGCRITRIELVIGELSSIVDDSILFYFDILSRGTLAEGACIAIRRESAQATCQDCGFQWLVNLPLPSSCPSCHGHRFQVTGGRAFYVESIEVNDEDTGCEGYSKRE